jgi:DNA repair protein RAD5
MDLVQRALNVHGFANVRLDGSLAQKQRAKVVADFTTSKQPSILVASLKAGGVGLNLIAATRVYVMDLWWNAAVESQAIDRIHRFGQTREVYVTRFLGKLTRLT